MSSPDPDRIDVPVVVVDDDPKLRTRLAMMLGGEVRPGLHPTLEALEEAGLPVPGCVLVLGPSLASADRFRELGRLRQGRELSAVIVVEQLSAELLQQAMRAGVSDVVSLPADGTELAEAVQRAASTLDLRAHVAQPEPPAPPVESSDGRGRLITVFAPKGGAGKSTISTNLAVLLARRNEGPVALVDCDLQFGDVAVMLQLAPQQTVATVADAANPDALLAQLLTHEPTGLRVLPAPTDPAQADTIPFSDVSRIIGQLRQVCDTVVVDTSNAFNDVVLGVLEESDRIVLVAGMDIPHIKNTKIALQTMRLLNIGVEKVTLVLNRANSKVRLDVGEVERAIGMRADCLIPSDIVVPQSINRGVPVVLDAPRSGVAKALERLAEIVTSATSDRQS
ncbi:MAG: CpaE family protein [Acidimicrobiia bacterium]